MAYVSALSDDEITFDPSDALRDSSGVPIRAVVFYVRDADGDGVPDGSRLTTDVRLALRDSDGSPRVAEDVYYTAALRLRSTVGPRRIVNGVASGLTSRDERFGFSRTSDSRLTLVGMSRVESEHLPLIRVRDLQLGGEVRYSDENRRSRVHRGPTSFHARPLSTTDAAALTGLIDDATSGRGVSVDGEGLLGTTTDENWAARDVDGEPIRAVDSQGNVLLSRGGLPLYSAAGLRFTTEVEFASRDVTGSPIRALDDDGSELTAPGGGAPLYVARATRRTTDADRAERDRFGRPVAARNSDGTALHLLADGSVGATPRLGSLPLYRSRLSAVDDVVERMRSDSVFQKVVAWRYVESHLRPLTTSGGAEFQNVLTSALRLIANGATNYERLRHSLSYVFFNDREREDDVDIAGMVDALESGDVDDAVTSFDVVVGAEFRVSVVSSGRGTAGGEGLIRVWSCCWRI